MNRYKIIIQCILVMVPIILFVIIPTELQWISIELLFGRDFSNLKNYLDKISVSEKFISIIIGLILSTVLLFILRFFNKKKLYNRGSKYHNYPIIFFYLAGEILGYRKVSLIRVPIHLQFIIVFKDWFDEIIVDSHPQKNDKPIINKLNIINKHDELNLILSDTYKIKLVDIPKKKRMLPCLFIERNTRFSGNRTYNPTFTATVREQTNIYRANFKQINIFATTNTKNTKEIILQSFKNAGRTGFETIYVYEQNSKYQFTEPHKVNVQ